MQNTRQLDLPIVLQREYNSYLYGALPLCAALGNGNAQWFERRFFQLFAIRDERGVMVGQDLERPYTHLDLVDALTVLDGPLSVERVEYRRAGAEVGRLSQYARAAVQDGCYLITFVDLATLHDREDPFLHEILIYGFDDDQQQIHAVTFGYNQRFQTACYDYALLDRSFERCLTGIERLRERSGVRFPIATLSVRSTEAEAVGAQKTMWSQLAAYRAGRPVDLRENYLSKYWWLWGPDDHAFYTSAPIRFGIGVIDTLIAHLHDAVAGQRPIDYRHFHLLAEHKRLLARRLEILLTDTDPQDRAGLVAAWKSVTAKTDANRLRVLRNRVAYDDGRWGAGFFDRQAHLVSVLSDALENTRKAELSVLDEILTYRPDREHQGRL
jgi:hypothetical protein